MTDSDRLGATAFTLSVDAVTSACVRALSESGIEAVLLKGPAIAHWLGAQRSYGDVDLLIQRDDIESAADLLRARGYVDLIADPGERLRLEPPHARTLVPAERLQGVPPCAVDLHWKFHGVTGPAERFWEAVARDVATIPIFGTDVRIPGREMTALIIGLHASQPKDAPQVKDDLERAVGFLPESVWEAAVRLAHEVGAANHLAIGLRTTSEGSEVADELGLPQGSDLTVTLFAEHAPGMSHGLQRLSEKRGLRERAIVLGRALVPTHAYMRSWMPLANRGPLGLAAAYAWRPFSLLARLPRAFVALRRARAETARRSG